MLQMVPHDESGQQRPPKALALELNGALFWGRMVVFVGGWGCNGDSM